MTLKLRAKVNFPASVTGAAGIAVTKTNGIWTVSPDFGTLTELTAIPNPENRQLWIYTPSTGLYNVVTFETLSDALNAIPIGVDLDLDGNKITNLADGTDDGDAINKGQADATYQPIDATLTSISDLGTAADKLAYTTGVDTWAETPLTSAARGLLDDSSVGAMRTTLGVGIGTDVQAYDPGLQSISGLTTAADKMIYTTASDTYAVTTLTTFARTILDDTDASTVRTTLGVAIGSNVQAYNARLADIAGITYAQGDILYHDGTNIVKLPKGTDGQFLKITATIPAWATLAGGGDMLAANNLSDVANTATARDNLGVEIGADVLAYDPYLHSNIPQNSKSAAYTTVLSDAQKHLFHPSADTTARTFTIDSNANVAYPVGTAITFINQNGGGVITISITSDTMRLAGTGTTGSRSLAANGIATAVKVATTEWLISGVGLS